MVAKTAAIFLVAALGELGGVYAIWRWRRIGASIWLVPVGLAALLAYAVVQTYQPETSFGRLYAAYAGVFLLGAMLWGWALDGLRPDRFDIIGAILVLAGITIILWGRVLVT
ncbi:MAG: YnfA family protein [Acidimicrobiia bacterium]